MGGTGRNGEANDGVSGTTAETTGTNESTQFNRSILEVMGKVDVTQLHVTLGCTDGRKTLYKGEKFKEGLLIPSGSGQKKGSAYRNCRPGG